MRITFIGNCQTVGLCFYFQQLLPNEDIKWVVYGNEIYHSIPNSIDSWGDKCLHKINTYDDSIQRIRDSDVIIYQPISLSKSTFCNNTVLNELIKKECIKIKIPSVYLHYSDFDNSIQELIKREQKKEVDITISDIFIQHRDENMLITYNHPKTIFFMKMMKKICDHLNIEFFKEEQYNHFMTNPNYMGLP